MRAVPGTGHTDANAPTMWPRRGHAHGTWAGCGRSIGIDTLAGGPDMTSPASAAMTVLRDVAPSHVSAETASALAGIS
jgi:hypothetical protein